MARGSGIGRSLVLVLAVVLAGIGGLIDVKTASAEMTRLDGYTHPPDQYDCGGQTSGQTDAAGRLYLACGSEHFNGGTEIRILSADGVLLNTVGAAELGPLKPITDVAPSPDGKFLYVAKTESVAAGQSYTGPRPIRRLKLLTGTGPENGTYTPDGCNQAGTAGCWGLTFDGRETQGRFLATDGLSAAGSYHLYVAWGNWTSPDLDRVIKYQAQPDGAVTPVPVTSFDPPGSELSGIAVSRNGETLYTTEQANLHSFVSKFARQAGGTYRFELSWGGHFGNAGESCGFLNGERVLASPYDVALDDAGDLYVANTGCGTVEKYTGASNPPAHRGGVDVRPFSQVCQSPNGSYGNDNPGGDACYRPHGLAVNGRGDIYVPQTHKLAKVNVPPPPTVTGVSPNNGPAGTTVTITGTNFSTAAGATTVSFGDRAATGVACASSTRCTATSPAGGSGVVDVLVSVGGRTSATNHDAKFGYPPPNDDFANAMPVGALPFGNGQASLGPTHAADDPVASCAPNGYKGSIWYKYTPNTATQINAHNFDSSTTAYVGVYTGQRAALTEVACGAPDGTRGHPYSVVNFNAAAGVTYYFLLGATGDGHFTTHHDIDIQVVDTPNPTVTGVSPNIGSAGDTVTISGTGFGTAAGATTVKFGALSPVTAGCATAARCTVTAPAPTDAMTTVQVSVTVGGRTSAANGEASQFHYRPVLQSLDPTSKTAGSPGFDLTLTGANFGGTAVVDWDGTRLTPTERSATRLVVAVPAGLVATAGTYPVAVRNGSGALSAALGFVVDDGPSPQPGSVAVSVFDETGASVPHACFFLLDGGTIKYNLCDARDAEGTDGVVTFAAVEPGPYTLRQSEPFRWTPDLDIRVKANELLPVERRYDIAPTVAITSPQRRAQVVPGQQIVLRVADEGGSGVASVQVRYCPGTTCAFGQGTRIGVDRAAPWSVTWRRLPAAGTYTLVARAVDAAGNRRDSAPVRVTVPSAARTAAVAPVSGDRATRADRDRDKVADGASA